MQVEVLDWGARIAAIRVPTKSGCLTDVILGYKALDDYRTDPYHMGSTVGRYANRIAAGSFTLQGEKIVLTQNEGDSGNHIHGGFTGFDKKTWSLIEHTSDTLTLGLFSPDAEEGYPGNLNVTTKYVLTAANQLQIFYQATTDKPTLVNLTNHMYFNLSDAQEHIDTHLITVHADTYAPLNVQHLPEAPFIQTVAHSLYDLRKPQPVKNVKGPLCNVNYFVNDGSEVKDIAVLEESLSGRRLTVASDYPAMQLYFAEFLDVPFRPFQGLCCEPHYAPNTPNIESYKSAVLLPSQEFKHCMYYSFDNF